jgi:hypothetical protein
VSHKAAKKARKKAWHSQRVWGDQAIAPIAPKVNGANLIRIVWKSINVHDTVAIDTLLEPLPLPKDIAIETRAALMSGEYSVRAVWCYTIHRIVWMYSSMAIDREANLCITIDGLPEDEMHAVRAVYKNLTREQNAEIYVKTYADDMEPIANVLRQGTGHRFASSIEFLKDVPTVGGTQ